MNYLNFFKSLKDVQRNEQEMHDLTNEAKNIILIVATQMYEKELAPEIYYLWDAIMEIAKAIEAANRKYR